MPMQGDTMRARCGSSTCKNRVRTWIWYIGGWSNYWKCMTCGQSR